MKAIAAIACALLSTAAIAQSDPPKSNAIVVEIQGSVLVNQGQQFEVVPSGTQLKAGDRVMAMSESSALLRYEDGCDVRVEPETVVTLDEGSPCAGFILASERALPAGLALGAAGGGVSALIYVPAIAVTGVLVYDEFFDDPSSP